MSHAPGLRRTSLSYVALATRSVADMRRFYERVVGMTDARPAVLGAVTLGWGRGHHVVELHDGDPGLVRFGLEVEDDGGFARVAERAAARGSTRVASPDGDGLLVHDPDGNCIHLHGPIDRSGEHSADPGRRPMRVQHVTLSTGDVDRMVAFYEGLGFAVSDRMGDRFVWLRSCVEHHSVAVVRGERPRGLDHFSFDLSSWDDFRAWCDRLSALGVAVQWGPGRHGPGNNLFLFFDDPDANHIELSAEMEQFWDDRAASAPRTWDEAPTTVNLWGGQVPAWRSTR